jgi:hypothetical protein
MLEELGKHAWVARARRMNWEEFQTLGLARQEALNAIIDRGRETSPPRLSCEEQTFFQSFEEQMESRK